ncbi:MAG TPA: hypothetical protein VI861_00890 [Rickettsiales bacterium]|nr:hypothetical protein [Rickettsiales bacterium]
MRKFFLVLTFLFFTTSCNLFDKDQREIDAIAKKDHRFCILLGLDFGEDDPLKTETYWRCRIILANHKITDELISTQKIYFNRNIKLYVNELIENFDRAFEKKNDYRNNFINNNHHQLCEKAGYDLYSLEQNKVEEYLKCRQRFIDDFNANPPFRKTEYLNRPADTYNLGFIINQRQDVEIANFDAAKEKYPLCVKFNIKTDKHKQCIKTFDDENICYKNANKARFAKEMEERVSCQKKLYLRFPDSMMKKDSKKEEEIIKQEERRKTLADISSGNNLYSLGIDFSQEKDFKGKDYTAKKEEEKLEKKNINSKEKLYTREELISLRKRFAASCNENATKEIDYYFNELNRQCSLIALDYREKNYEQ